MGMGHQRQCIFFKVSADYPLSHGGLLRNRRRGRGQRPFSSRSPVHLVFKVHQEHLRSKSLRSAQNFRLIMFLMSKYSRKFFVKIIQISVQGNHVHLLISTSRRSLLHSFLRVTAGQIAQRFEKAGYLFSTKNAVTDTPALPRNHRKKNKLWKYRPFTRVVKGYRDYRIVRNYIQLNEKEAQKKIRYQKKRLKGLSSGEWEILWS